MARIGGSLCPSPPKPTTKCRFEESHPMNRNWKNRAERRRYEKMLRAVARSGVSVAEMGIPKGWDCDCIACSLLRAGACSSCAARINADILKREKPGKL